MRNLRMGLVVSAAAALVTLGLSGASASAEPVADQPVQQTVLAGSAWTAGCIGPVSPDGGAGACFNDARVEVAAVGSA